MKIFHQDENEVYLTCIRPNWPVAILFIILTIALIFSTVPSIANAIVDKRLGELIVILISMGIGLGLFGVMLIASLGGESLRLNAQGIEYNRTLAGWSFRRRTISLDQIFKIDKQSREVIVNDLSEYSYRIEVNSEMTCIGFGAGSNESELSKPLTVLQSHLSKLQKKAGD